MFGKKKKEEKHQNAFVKILGAGCKNCEMLEANVRKALAESGLADEVEHVTEIDKIVAYGVMQTPSLVFGDEVVSVGRAQRRRHQRSHHQTQGDVRVKMLEEFCPDFVEKMYDLETEVENNMPFDEKTYQLICFALAVKSRSAPCVKKHFRGALMAGATVKQVSYTLALVMKESAGADDCWTHEVIGDWTELLKEDFQCCCNR